MIIVRTEGKRMDMATENIIQHKAGSLYRKRETERKNKTQPSRAIVLHERTKNHRVEEGELAKVTTKRKHTRYAHH
jgi:hypothetical protein